MGGNRCENHPDMNRTDWVTDTKLFVSICIYDHSQNRREHFTLSSELFNHSAKV